MLPSVRIRWEMVTESLPRYQGQAQRESGRWDISGTVRS